MKHNLKLLDGTIQTIDCRRGSGVFDCNSREIYEGDIVQVETFEKRTATVEFYNGVFWLGNLILVDLPVIYYPTLKVVGHVNN